MKKVAEKENGRRRTPAARALSDRLYNALTESSPDGIIVHQQGILVHANSRALNLFGAVSLAQLQSRKVLELLHPELGEVVREARLTRQDGSEIQVEVYANLIDYGGKKATQVVVRDITARRLAEETLRLSEEKLARAFASNPAAICMARLNDGVIIEVNEAWEETFGYTRSDAMGKSKMDLDIWPSPDSREKFAQELREKGSFRSREQMLLRKSGEPFVSLASAEVLVIAGEYVVLWTWLDISDRKRAEKALQEANATLEKKVQQRTAQLRALAGELTLAEQRERRRLARILHDHLQQLLVAAKFRIAVLGRGGDDVAKQAAREVEDLLDESITASRSLTAELSPPILHEAGLNAGLQWLARRMADKHGLFIELEVEEPGQLPDDLKIMLFESIRELLFNVVKHARSRSASVNLRRVDGALQVTVADHGIGFDPDALAREPGPGLGLFGVRERIQLVGGALEINSRPSHGSRLVISVPITEADWIEPQSVPAPEGLHEEKVDAVAPAERKIRVMLADDHAVVRQGIANMLGNEPDIEVVGAAADGQEAVTLAHKLLPDIILMDISMPKLNGVEATRIIHNQFREICVIGLSMFEEVERAQAMRDAGAVHYLTKSGAAEALVNAVRKYGTRHRNTIN